MTGVGSLLTAGYTAEGRRAWKQTAGGKTYFLYDGNTPVCELSSLGSVQATTTFGLTGLLARKPAGAASTFYTFDPQGSPVLRLDASANVLGAYAFDAYGARQGTDSSTDPYSGFGAQAGYYADWEAGLSLLGQRYYDAGTGRFVTRDPIGQDARRDTVAGRLEGRSSAKTGDGLVLNIIAKGLTAGIVSLLCIPMSVEIVCKGIRKMRGDMMLLLQSSHCKKH